VDTNFKGEHVSKGEALKFGSVCSGIEAALQGTWELMGCTCGAVDRETD